MIALLFATHEEAASLLSKTKACLLPELPGSYSSSFGVIAITGIGPFAAAVATHRLLSELPIKKIYNFGLAGALSSSFSIGSLHEIRKVAKDTWHPKGPLESSKSIAAKSFVEIEFADVQGPSLLTCDRPVYENISPKFDLGFDLVDMEGYAIAWQAKQFQIPCHLYKLVSDFCSQASSKQIEAHLKTYSDLLAQGILNLAYAT